MKKFWMVWREGNQAPSVKHETRKKAQEEAERLSSVCGSCERFYVLEALSITRRLEIVTENLD